LDESHHPFCGGTSRDVRITTRYNDGEFVSSLMGVLHETGHGLYEQNLPEKWLGQPVGAACGMSVHESQSLFMEMQVCRSAEFVNFAAPSIRKHLGQYVENPESLHADNLVRLLSRVSPGLIRVDADEVTYPAHIILRFEIESELLKGSLKLSDLPEAWNEKMTQLLGLSTAGNDKNGCMQDVHWPSGSFGYFPAYTFGAVIAAQLFAEMKKSLPQVGAQIAQGDFAQMQSWLRDRVWSQGSRLQTLELVKAASGRDLGAQDFHAHLRRRYLNS
jgi:carboxypeptidase Taq